MNPAAFTYLVPYSLDEAIGMLHEWGRDAKLLAGGHSLLPIMKLRLAQPTCLIDIARIPGLSGIRQDGDRLVIGARTTHAEVLDSELVGRLVPGLHDAAEHIADVQVRNRGTIGGSLAHADPGGDFPVILAALDATIIAVGLSGSRTIPISEFFVALFTTALAEDEVLTEIHVPLGPAAAASGYIKLPNPASGYVVVSAGAALERDSQGRCTVACIAVGGLEGTPVRAEATEAALIGQPLAAETIREAARHAAEGTQPDGDLYATADYKRAMAPVYTRMALESAAARLNPVIS